MRGEELELAAEVSRRRLRRLRVVGVAHELVVELLRGDADTVEVALVAEVHPERHHVDVETVHLVFRDVSARVGHDGHLAPDDVGRVLLALHVVGLFAGDRPEAPCDPEHLGRIVGVNVHPHLVLQPGHHQACADGRKLLAQVTPVHATADHDTLGAVAEFQVLFEACRGLARGVDHRGYRHRGLVIGPALDVIGDARNEFDETLAARIDDVRLAQDLELLCRARERLLGHRDASPQQRPQIPYAFPPHAVHLVREIAEHRDDGSLARLAQAFSRVERAAVHTVREVRGAQVAQVSELVAHAEKELRQDRTRVAARTVQRCIGDARERLAGVAVGEALKRAEHRAHREREVRAGVAVRDGEHVDLVQVLLAREQPQDAGLERAIEA